MTVLFDHRRLVGGTVALGLMALTTAVPAAAADPLPAGPYQLSNVAFAMVGVTFDEAAVRAILPKNLEPADGFTGGFDFYVAPQGWGITPFSAGYIWVDIKGHDSSSNEGARYFAGAFYSDKAHDWLAGLGLPIPAGRVVQTDADGVVTATVGPDGGATAATIAIKPDPAACQPMAGTHNYIGPPDANGMATWYTLVPYAMTFCNAEAVKVDIADPALAAFKPKQINWAGWSTDGAIVLGITEPLQ